MCWGLSQVYRDIENINFHPRGAHDQWGTDTRQETFAIGLRNLPTSLTLSSALERLRESYVCAEAALSRGQRSLSLEAMQRCTPDAEGAPRRAGPSSVLGRGFCGEGCHSPGEGVSGRSNSEWQQRILGVMQVFIWLEPKAGVSSPWPVGRMWPNTKL